MIHFTNKKIEALRPKVYAKLHELASHALWDSVSLSVRRLNESGSILKDHYPSMYVAKII